MSKDAQSVGKERKIIFLYLAGRCKATSHLRTTSDAFTMEVGQAIPFQTLAFVFCVSVVCACSLLAQIFPNATLYEGLVIVTRRMNDMLEITYRLGIRMTVRTIELTVECAVSGINSIKWPSALFGSLPFNRRR